MKISEKGLNLIKSFEGCRLQAYQDSVGVWTIGYGTTNADKAITGKDIVKGLQISQATADDWLRKSIDKKYGPKVEKYDSIYRWNQNEYDALVSFAYNIGSIDQLTANGTRSRAVIADKILEYRKAGGKVLAGLVNRRKQERELFLIPVGVKTGWQPEDGGWRYYYQDSSGRYVSGAWYEDKSKGKWYWFGDDGLMTADQWITYKGRKCYLGSDGAMVTGLQQIDSQHYYFDSDGYMVTEPVTFVPDQSGALRCQ